MRYSEQFMEHIEYAFHAFCKIVLRHEAINAWRDLKRKEAREISDLEKRICNLNYDIFLLICQQKRFFVFYFQPQNQQTAIIFMVHFIWNYGMLYKKENQIQKECIV